jgi:hypothetical protein
MSSGIRGQSRLAIAPSPMVTIRFAVPALRSAWRLSRSSIDHFIHKFVIGIFLNGSQTAGATGIRLT